MTYWSQKQSYKKVTWTKKYNPLINSGLGDSCQFCFGINLVVLHQHIGGYKEIDKELQISTP
jgi:hypothetical protein